MEQNANDSRFGYLDMHALSSLSVGQRALGPGGQGPCDITGGAAAICDTTQQSENSSIWSSDTSSPPPTVVPHRSTFRRQIMEDSELHLGEEAV